MSSPLGEFYCSGNGREVDVSMCFNKHRPAEISFHRDIPHWQQDGVLQYITFRLADSLPQSKIAEFADSLADWYQSHPQPWTDADLAEYEKLQTECQKWLDAGYGSCVLRHPNCIGIIVEALRHFDGVRYELYDYVVMPNHIHFIILPYEEYSLPGIIHSLKSFTSNAINRLLNRRGALWQKEYFDRLIRSPKDYEETAAYILQNAQFRYHLPFSE